MSSPLDEAEVAALAASIGPLDDAAMAATRERLDSLTKPPGSLGRLEELAVTLAGIAGRPNAATRPRTIIVAAGDHGVARHGVSAYPPSVTGQMVANFLAGGAAISVLARAHDASLVVVDAGVEGRDGRVPTGTVRLVDGGRGRGTADMTVGPAMSRDDALAAIGLGSRVARDALDRGAAVIVVGEMGIGNTTAASALTAVFTGATPDRVTGAGTGLDEHGRRRKAELIGRALRVNGPDPRDPLGVLAAVGGLEIGVLVGVLLTAAASRIPVVLDGFITAAAALVASGLGPGLPSRLIAAHRSAEPGHAVALDHLRLRPLLDLDLRLGEGTGAALALGLLDATVALRDGMATFAEAGVSGREEAPAAVAGAVTGTDG